MKHGTHNSGVRPFWEFKALEAMTEAEWESLCDGCGRCCVHKLEDEETGEVFVTDIACELLDMENCRCRDYRNRQRVIPDCLQLTPALARTLGWLPPTCAYRRLAEGKGLPAWHPLLTGDPNSTRSAGMSAANRVITMDEALAIYGKGDDTTEELDAV